MPDTKTSGLAAASAPDGSGGTLFPVVQAGNNYKLNDAQLLEFIQDTVAAQLGSGAGATSISYNDTTGAITVTSTDTSLTTEQVQDIVGALAAAGTGATVVYDDTGNALTISATGGGGGGGATHPAYRSLAWYPIWWDQILSGSSQTGITGVMIAIPFVVPRDMTISQLAVTCVVAGSGSNLAMAIYAGDPATGRATGDPLATTANISTATSGVVSGSLSSSVTLTAGSLYFVGFMTSTSTASFSRFSGNSSGLGYLIGTTFAEWIQAGNFSPASAHYCNITVYGSWPTLSSGTSWAGDSGRAFAVLMKST